MSTLPIGDYALISDCHSAGLVSRGGGIDWLCFPRLDAPSVFARILDDSAGTWSIRPADVTATSRRYVDDTMVLETTFTTTEGTAILRDALSLGSGERGHDVGMTSPHLLMREIACDRGRIEFDITYSPRPEYGLILPVLTPNEGGIAARG